MVYNTDQKYTITLFQNENSHKFNRCYDLCAEADIIKFYNEHGERVISNFPYIVIYDNSSDVELSKDKQARIKCLEEGDFPWITHK